MSNILSVDGLNVHYGLFQAVFDISFEVAQNEAICLLGSNGAGKTSTLKGVLGALDQIKGTVKFMGQDISGMTADQITAFGIIYIPEGRELFPNMTVLENLELGAITTNARRLFRQSLEFSYDLFPILADRHKQLAGTLSGGQQQMVAIARGLISRPKLLMLDEPSLGLAPVIVEQVYKALQRILESGTPLVLVEQHIYHALNLCTRGYVLQSGKIAQSGNRDDLLTSPSLKSNYLGSN
jgi:branched-chain amino acid transport system ATP-binding protein